MINIIDVLNNIHKLNLLQINLRCITIKKQHLVIKKKHKYKKLGIIPGEEMLEDSEIGSSRLIYAR